MLRRPSLPFLPADALHGRHATEYPSRLVAALRGAARREPTPKRPPAVPSGEGRPGVTLLPKR